MYKGAIEPAFPWSSSREELDTERVEVTAAGNVMSLIIHEFWILFYIT